MAKQGMKRPEEPREHRTIVLHARPDDFTSQPAGAAGAKIACGEIRRVGCR